MLAFHSESYYLTPGFVMTGLGLICFSIFSKAGLLALVWRRTFSLADQVPLLAVSHGAHVSVPGGVRVPGSRGRLKCVHTRTGARRAGSDLRLALSLRAAPRPVGDRIAVDPKPVIFFGRT